MGDTSAWMCLPTDMCDMYFGRWNKKTYFSYCIDQGLLQYGFPKDQAQKADMGVFKDQASDLSGGKIAEMQGKIDLYWAQMGQKLGDDNDMHIWNTKTGDIMYVDPKAKKRVEMKYDPDFKPAPEPEEKEGDGKTTTGDAKAGDAKATDEKACDALADATDDAKAECKKWAGKKCADEKEEDQKKACESAKASAKALAAGAIALLGVAALM